jgi:hypothetical protein
MKIEVDIPLNADETKQLAGILGVKVGELGKALQPFAKSATDEYIRMFLPACFYPGPRRAGISAIFANPRRVRKQDSGRETCLRSFSVLANPSALAHPGCYGEIPV